MSNDKHFGRQKILAGKKATMGISVDTTTLGNLLGNGQDAEIHAKQLRIPYYQRPYVWDEKYVSQFLESIKRLTLNEDRHMLLGTLILAEAKDNGKTVFDVVDGQQRLTTLSLLYANPTEQGWKLPMFGGDDDDFGHSESRYHIKQNFKIIENWREANVHLDIVKVANRMHFIVVITDNLDDAFVFFDSQNSRGKPLEVFDLLKANNLRFIDDSRDEGKLQRECAVLWEQIESEGEKGNTNGALDAGDAAPTMGYLLNGLIETPRSYARGDHLCSLKDDFRCRRLGKKHHRNMYLLNNYSQPPIFKSWTRIANGHNAVSLKYEFRDVDATFGTKSMIMQGDPFCYYPFQLMQQIEGGECFFWFVAKYQRVYKRLFVTPGRDIPFALTELMRNIRSVRSTGYIRRCFEAALVFYYDKFGMDAEDDAIMVALSLEHALFYRQIIRRVHPKWFGRYLKDVGFNPFRVIDEAQTPEHVIDTVREKFSSLYSSPVGDLSGPSKEYVQMMIGLLKDWCGRIDLSSDVLKMCSEMLIQKRSVVKEKMEEI